MKPELDKALCKKYPKIFADRHGDKRVTAMCWGFSCGDGWFTIIDCLCRRIKGHVEWEQKQDAEYPDIKAAQVKEKFGSLRFYTNYTDDKIEGMIRMAESMSMRICEYCGTTSDVGCTEGWIRTICRECAEENNHLGTWGPIES